MTVYVDELVEYPLRYVRGAERVKYWCHMWADDVDDLHAMAAKIGMRRDWFQDKHPMMLHYDLSQTRRKLAIANGAVEMSFIQWLRNKRQSEES